MFIRDDYYTFITEFYFDIIVFLNITQTLHKHLLRGLRAVPMNTIPLVTREMFLMHNFFGFVHMEE